MGQTSIYQLPYPEPTDAVANYPALGQSLAGKVEAALATYATPHVARYKNVQQALTAAATWYTVTFEVDEASQTRAGITYANGIFTVARAGVYQVNTCLDFTGTAQHYRSRIAAGAPAPAAVESIADIDGPATATNSRALLLPAGGTVTISAYAVTATGGIVYGSGIKYTTVDITLIAP